MLFNSSVYIGRHPVRLADKNCDASVINLYIKNMYRLDGRLVLTKDTLIRMFCSEIW